MFKSNEQTASEDAGGGGIGGGGWLAWLTGLNLAVAACAKVCETPYGLTLSWKTRLIRSVVYLVVACVAGAVGTWMVLPRGRDGLFRRLVLLGVRGWVFVPAVVLFSQQQSVLGPCFAVLAAVLMARVAGRFVKGTGSGGAGWASPRGLFAEEVRLAPASGVSFGVALCVYGGGLAAVAGEPDEATALLAGGVFLLVVQIVASRVKGARGVEGERRVGPYALVAAALVCVFLALSAPPASSGALPLLGQRHTSGGGTKKVVAAGRTASSGFQTIVLWPEEKKKEKVILSPVLKVDAVSTGLAQPWEIPFYGPYWYFKFAGDTPGPNARTTRGDPLKVNVFSTDRGPLLMEAHQKLAKRIDLSCCRAMEVVFRNDVAQGAFAVGLTLTDSRTAGKGGVQNLGMRSVYGGASGTLPVEERVTFPLPRAGTIQSFDAITVTLVPDATHWTTGRKVAVERFVMIPR